MRTPDDDVYWIHDNHLGSAIVTTDGTTVTSGTQFYYPYGAYLAGDQTATPYRFTGQRHRSTL